nr:hypothetical protein [Sulfuracidifex metallicus]
MRLDHLEKVREVSERNLNCLKRTLIWNMDHDILFFRISSNTIPFASHPKMSLNWRDELGDQLRSVGDVIMGRIRISMHPGQYVVLNSNRREVVESSVAELSITQICWTLWALMDTFKYMWEVLREAKRRGYEGFKRTSIFYLKT